MERVGELIPETARRLGLDAELRLARAISTWAAIVAEHVPAATGACRLVELDGREIVIEVDEPIVAQEIRLRLPQLLAAFHAAPGGVPAEGIRLRIGRRGTPL